MIHELNKGRVKTEDRLVLASEDMDNDDLMLEMEDGVFDWTLIDIYVKWHNKNSTFKLHSKYL